MFLKDILLGIKFRLIIFSFQFLKDPYIVFLVCIDSYEKCAVILIFVHLEVMSFFLYGFKYLFIPCFKQFNCDVPYWLSRVPSAYYTL